jgi:hypothetical protein
MTLQRMGSSLLQKVYKDLPQCFTQENDRNIEATRYKVELAIMDKEEHNRILRELQYYRATYGAILQ